MVSYEDNGTRSKNQKIKWKCLCECGNISHVATYDLRKKKSTQCGSCSSIEIATKHGYSNTKEYRTYQNMIIRCTNPKYQGYKHYGGRGIQMKFTSFEEFLNEVGDAPSKDHSIDRINTNGHYELGNIKWSTWSEQRRNRRNVI